jgi:hypothetical protein
MLRAGRWGLTEKEKPPGSGSRSQLMSLSNYPPAVSRFVPLCPAQQHGFKLQDISHAIEYFGGLGWTIAPVNSPKAGARPYWKVLRPNHPFGNLESLSAQTLKKWWRRETRSLCNDARNAGLILSRYRIADDKEKFNIVRWAQLVSDDNVDGAAWQMTYTNIIGQFQSYGRLSSRRLSLAWAAEKAGLNSVSAFGLFILTQCQRIDSEIACL